MANRKIAECINVRINVGNYQHIELTKYAEEQVNYETKEELKLQEDSLRDDLISSLIRSMKVIPEKLGKGVESAQEIEEAIQKAIPEWLEKGPVPNIANIASKNNVSDAARQKDNKDLSSKNLAEVVKTTKIVNATPTETEETGKTEDEGTEDLFEEDEMPKSEKLEGSEKSEEVVAPSEETKTDEEPEKVEAKNDELSSIFDEEDDDLFGNV